MISNMKRAILVLSCLFILIGLFAYTGYLYSKTPKRQPVVMVPQSQYQQALDTMKVHDNLNAKELTAKQAALDSVTKQRDTLCTTYKVTKTNPALCQ